MTDIIAFLTARVDEDEALASAATPGSWVTDDPLMSDFVGASESKTYVADCSVSSGYRHGSIPDAAHIARHNPARVLADVAAKRAIVAMHRRVENMRIPRTVFCNCQSYLLYVNSLKWPCDALKLLALPFADHPDYDESWRP